MSYKYNVLLNYDFRQVSIVVVRELLFVVYQLKCTKLYVISH